MYKTEPIPWRGIRALEKLVMFALPLLAAAVLAVNLLDEALLRRLSRLTGTGSVLSWLANGYNSYIAFAGILILLILFASLVRYRMMRDKRLWFGTGCPNCKERELVRVKRNFSDRFYGLIGVPAYRYACRNCVWRGLRVARREYSLERELEKERALLRFQPDGEPYLEEFVDEEYEVDDFEPVDFILEEVEPEGVAPEEVWQEVVKAEGVGPESAVRQDVERKNVERNNVESNNVERVNVEQEDIERVIFAREEFERKEIERREVDELLKSILLAGPQSTAPKPKTRFTVIETLKTPRRPKRRTPRPWYFERP